MKNWFINQSLNHPKRTIILCLVFTAFMASGLRFFYIEDDMMKILPKNMPTRKTWDAIKEEFGNTEFVYIAFGRPGESVFKKSTMATLWDLTEMLEAMPEVDEVNCITTMNRMDNEDGFLMVDDLIPSRELIPEELSSVTDYLNLNPELKVRFISGNGDYMNVMVKPYDSAKFDILAIEIRKLAEEYLEGYDVHIGGIPYVTGTMPALIRDDVLMLVRAGMVVMVLILLSSLRSIPGVLMVFSVIFLSLISMLGSMGWIYHFTGSDRFVFSLVNTSMPIILLTIANSDGVHVMTKFFKKLRLLKDKKKAITQTLMSLLMPIFLTSLTTIVAFLSMIFSPLEVQTGYGVCIAIGITWAWILSSTFLPSLIGLKKWDMDSKAVKQSSYLENIIDKFGKKVLHSPKKVLGSGIILILVGLIGINWLNVEVDIQSFFGKETEIRQSLEFLDKEMVGTMDLQFRVEGDMKEPVNLEFMENLQIFLESHPQVTTAFSIADIVKQMHCTVMDDDPAYEIIPDTRGKVNNLFTMYSMSGDPDDFSSLVDYDYSVGLTTALMRNMSSKEIISFVEDIEELIAEDSNTDLGITITGMMVVFRDLVGLIVRSSFISISVSIIVIALIAGFFFNRLIWGALAVVPLTTAVILNFGFMGIFGIDLSHITAILSSIIIGVGVDFSIHYISQYKRLVKHGTKPDVLSRKVVDDVGYPIILDALSNMAFGALLFSWFVPIQHMGGLMVFSMVSTSVGTLTLLATLAEIFKVRLIRKRG